MSYKNGLEIFPKELLHEIQKYVSGGMVYIPQTEDQQKAWGELSGIRAEISGRNVNICREFQTGKTIAELAEDYCLAEETIKRIVYNKKNKTRLSGKL